MQKIAPIHGFRITNTPFSIFFTNTKHSIWRYIIGAEQVTILLHFIIYYRRWATHGVEKLIIRNGEFGKTAQFYIMYVNFVHYYNLTKVAETHPSLEEDLKKGWFGIKTTEKLFSKQTIDLPLEQTIIAYSGRRFTGVVQFTNSISAR